MANNKGKLRVLIILLTLLLSLFLSGCLGPEKDMGKAQKNLENDIEVILQDNSSVEDIRSAIIETLETEKIANNT